MQHVALRALELDGFKSFVRQTRVTFSPTGGFKFLGGKNEQEPRLGPNGAGKSTLWDGVCWVCYGTAVNGQKSSELVTWGKKRPRGNVWLDIDGVGFEIERLGSPEQIAIDGEITTQAAVNSLLRLSRSRFLHAVIFGQGVPFFVDLSVPERGVLLDEVLDLKIWLQATETAGQHALATRGLLDVCSRTMAFERGRLEGLPDIRVLEHSASTWDASERARIEASIARMDAASDEGVELEMAWKAALEKISPAEKKQLDAEAESLLKSERGKVQLEEQYRELHRQITAAQAELEHNIEHPNCPTCRQKYPVAERKNQRLVLEARIAEIRLKITRNGMDTNSLIAAQNSVRADHETQARKYAFYVEQARNAEIAFVKQSAVILSIVEQVERDMEERPNPFAGQIARVLEDRKAIEHAIDECETETLKLAGELEHFEFWRATFKRVRLYMVDQILAHLTIEVENAAALLGLQGWRVEFLTETETKSGTLKQGVQVRVTSPTATASWESWSGGESQRIRLAVALGFSSMIQLQAGVSFDFEVWDEPTQWLSAEGLEDLLQCLKYRADSTKRSVWLLDHRAIVHSGFDEIWTATKDDNGTRIERTGRAV